VSSDSEPDREEYIAAVSKTARVTIPKPLREKHGISAPGEVAFVETQDGRMVVRPIGSMREFRGLPREGADDRPATAILREERNRDTQQ